MRSKYASTSSGGVMGRIMDTDVTGGSPMRHAVICALLMLLSTGAALGQEWVEFTSIEDGFRIAFPGQPQVQNTTYTSQYGYTLPAKVYSVTSGPQRFAVTVV